MEMKSIILDIFIEKENILKLHKSEKICLNIFTYIVKYIPFEYILLESIKHLLFLLGYYILISISG